MLFLTARDDTQDRIMGLTVGGDDYVTKPFQPSKSWLASAPFCAVPANRWKTIRLFASPTWKSTRTPHDVTRAGQPVDLSPTEYKLLRYLMDNEGRVLSRHRFSTMSGNTTGAATQPSSESYISYLRKESRRHRGRRRRRRQAQGDSADRNQARHRIHDSRTEELNRLHP